MVAERAVRVNGGVESRKRRQLVAGDEVLIGDRTLVVRVRG